MQINNNPTIHIGRNIACIRIIKGIKQAAFASALGISQQAISKMEQSEDISYAKLLHVSEVLGVTVDAIRSFNESKITGEA